jgi:hypothetical protein
MYPCFPFPFPFQYLLQNPPDPAHYPGFPSRSLIPIAPALVWRERLIVDRLWTPFQYCGIAWGKSGRGEARSRTHLLHWPKAWSQLRLSTQFTTNIERMADLAYRKFITQLVITKLRILGTSFILCWDFCRQKIRLMLSWSLTNLSMKEVYNKLVIYTISKYRNLDILSYAGIGDSRTEIRPEYWPISSWISRSYYIRSVVAISVVLLRWLRSILLLPSV